MANLKNPGRKHYQSTSIFLIHFIHKKNMSQNSLLGKAPGFVPRLLSECGAKLLIHKVSLNAARGLASRRQRSAVRIAPQAK
jgi:hypothetical protein